MVFALILTFVTLYNFTDHQSNVKYLHVPVHVVGPRERRLAIFVVTLKT
jgi:hypothetical protein